MERLGCMDRALTLFRRHRKSWFTNREVSKRLGITPQQAQTAIDNLKLKGKLDVRFSEVMMCKEYQFLDEGAQVFLLQQAWRGVCCSQPTGDDDDEGLQAG